MPLSRLENFLKNAEGNILYVNPSDFDATDSFENQGNSLARPFKTIQRALIEAARFSYQQGRNNDKIDRTTILVYPGTHYIDNRPGFSIQEVNGAAVYKKRTGYKNWSESVILPFSEDTNYDILDTDNELYKFNSVNGGAILPRGTSIIGLDLRKTKIRPLYVPNPEDPLVDNSSIFNVTGTCYFTAFTFFDADLTKTVFKDYNNDRYVPNFSHHKLVSFAYGDGVNLVKLGSEQTNLSDLDMYYYKVARAYGDITGRGLVDYPVGVDFEPSVDEYRIVGSLDANPLGISSIRAGNGDGSGDLSIITVTTADRQTGDEKPHNLFVDSPVLISGIAEDTEAYNGNFTVKEVVGLTTFTYQTTQVPGEPLPDAGNFTTATVVIGSDTVNSASPYIFNCSIRSVYGLCGMWADGSKATGFKSMVVAQFTGVSLQRDDNAFIIYDNGSYYDNLTLPENSLERPLHTNSRSIFKPDWENFHIRASNDSFIQCVSVFAIGYSKHFLTESGGDMSITNSNSNFGAIALQSDGFKPEAFDRDDVGYITHIIPPKELSTQENEVTWLSLDVAKIINSTSPEKLYLYTQTNPDVPPPHQIDGYRIGARHDDKLYLTVTIGTGQTTYSTPILMPVNSGDGIIAKKEYTVTRNGEVNSITSNILTFDANHKLINGEKVRLFSDTGQAPVGLEVGVIYYAITTGLGANQIRLAISLNDAIANVPITGIGDDGGRLTIVSTVSDKLPGEIGHPIQYDNSVKNWYITGTGTTTSNGIYSTILNNGIDNLGNETASTFFKRVVENRSIDDRVYKFRYVIPKEYENARPPQAGFIIQESKNVGVTSVSFTNDNLTNTKELRNEKVISNATASGIIGDGQQIVTITTELPHKFSIGDIVDIKKVRSANNSDSTGITSTYNGSYRIFEIPNSKQFKYYISGVSTNPGTFTNDINSRNTRQQREALPLVSRKEYNNTFFAYRVATVKKHIPGADGQDGIYHIIALSSNVSPTENVGFNLSSKKYNQDVRNLYPQVDRDNANSDPDSTVSHADLAVIGKVVTDDKRHSLTKEAISYFVKNSRVGLAVTGISLSGVGNTTITVYSELEHGLNQIKSISFSPGAGYQPSKTIYSQTLTPVIANGSGATFKITTNSSGAITGVSIVDPGSGYAQNNTFTIPGGTTLGIVTVTSISSNINDSLEIGGVIGNDELNNAFRILSVPTSKTVVLHDDVGITTFVPNTNGVYPYAVLSSSQIGITSIKYTDVSTGIVTVTTTQAHGLLPGNKIRLVGSGTTVYNGDFTVNENVGINTFNFYVGITSLTPSSTKGFVLKRTVSSNAFNLGRGEENLGSRCSYIYAGISTTTSAELTVNSTTITLSNANGFKRGDYIAVNSEIMRLISATNPFTVIRGTFGTIKTTASTGTLVKKINVLPIQFHRPSFMRASGHTFEYLGYGPGNYSTGMPQKQDRILSEDEVLTSQAREQKGGTVVYTGMNDLGEFYSGTVKFVSSSGQDVVIEAPILTFTGDDAQGEATAANNGIFDDVLVKQRLTVEGGENNNQTSQFYGPVNFTQKVVNTSDDGIVTKNLFLKGLATQPKLITVGISTPTDITFSNPKPGDISLLSIPNDEFLGHIRVGSEWRRFAPISKEKDSTYFNFDRLSVNKEGTTSSDFEVVGDALFQNIKVTGDAVFDQPLTLGNVTFENIFVRRTARFQGIGVDPVTGLTTTYTQIHEVGISKLNHLEVVGVSTFTGLLDANGGATIDNIRIGISSDNEIDTSTGNLTIDSAGGTTTIDDNLTINGNTTAFSTSFLVRTQGTTAGTAGVLTASITNSRVLELGIGNTNGGSQIDLHNDDRVYPDYSLRIIRNAGIGSQSSEIIHRGNQPLFINAFDNGGEVKILTNNTERFTVGFSGTITSFQNNTGENLKGAHFKINQAGRGDVVLSWDITHNNANRRWYAGIDTSDGYSWKLAAPLNTVAYGSENFDTSGETKLKVDNSGNISIGGSVTMNGGRSLHTLAVGGSFDLINQNISTINAFGSATQINIGSNTTSSQVFLRGQTESTTKDSGALVVDGGVGIEKNLYVGSLLRVLSTTDSASKDSGALVVEGGVGIEKNLYVGAGVTVQSTLDSTSKDNGALVVEGGVGIEKRLNVGTNLNVSSNATIGGTLNVTGSTTLSNTLDVTSNLRVNTNKFTVDATTGNTIVAGTLSVTGNTTLNSNVTLLGANAASTEFFKIKTSAGSDRFVVDSFNGNTTISGTLNVTGATTLSSTLGVTGATTLSSTLGVTGATTLSSTLAVTGNVTLNSNVTLVGAAAASTEFFKIQTSTNVDRFTVDSFNGNTSIAGTLAVTGATTLSSTLSVTGATTLSSTLAVTGATTLSSTLTVTGNTVLNSNVTMVGAAAASTEVFRIRNSSSVDKFTVDSFNGNTSIAGTLGVTGATTLSSTLGVTGNTTLGGTLGLTGNFTINTDKFSVTASSGNTSIAGTLGVTGATTLSSTLAVTGNVTLNSNVTLVGAAAASTEFFKIQTSTNVDRFTVDSFNGNTSIAGTLSVTGATTLSSTLGVTGATTLGSTLAVTGNFTINTNKFSVTASSGNTSIAGTLSVTGATTLSSTLGVTGATTLSSTLSVTGNTTLSGTLSVTGDTTLNSNVTMVGAAAASTEVFRIRNSSSVDRFTVDSFNGNTTISGTLAVTGATTLSSTLGVTGATTLGSTLAVTGNVTLNSNVTLVGAAAASTEFFKIQTSSAVDKFTVDSFNGNTSIAGTLAVTGATTLSSTLGVTGNFTINTDKFSVTASSGNTSIAGTLAVTGNTTLSGTLTVTGNTVLNSNVTMVGAAAASTEVFRIRNSSSVDRFTVDSFNGNTSIAGTLAVTGATTLSSTLAVTGAITGSSTLSITDNAIFGKSITMNGSTTANTELFKITDGTNTKFQVDSTNGNTSISGTLSLTGNFTINTDKFSVTASSGNTSIAGTLGVTGNTTLGGTLGLTGNFTINTNKFSVTASNGNTSIAGTLGVTGASTLSGNVSMGGNLSVSGTLGVTGATTLSSTLAVSGNLTINTDKFIVTASSGNTSIAGTLAVTSNFTINSNKFGVTASNGNTSIAGTLSVTGSAAFTSTLTALNGNFQIANDSGCALELIRSSGTYIDFRRGTEDYNARIDNFTSGAITITNPSSTGNLRVQNDIIAFVSDIRLKTNIVTIDNALEKVCKLHGFTYNFNETAEKIGWDTSERHIGVSAQDVKAVVPEAIRKAPISDVTETDYMTVQYEKLVPLLIEAIKELKAEVDQLKNK